VTTTLLFLSVADDDDDVERFLVDDDDTAGFLFLSSLSSSSPIIELGGRTDDTSVLDVTFPSSDTAGFSNDLERFGGLPGPLLFGGDNDADANSAAAGGLPAPLLIPAVEDVDPADDADPRLLCCCFFCSLFVVPFAILPVSDLADDATDDVDDAGAPSSLAE
jgi:hypothetical protein